MMLPILISPSLAPGSYFFCAVAEVAISAALANAAIAPIYPKRAGIVFSRFLSLVLAASLARDACAGKRWVFPLGETALLPGAIYD
ncbi:hypothetical protein [Bradyrhizobium sp. BR 1433]|uniref:hypothetical protein n=1 Tax=Bradyrhizobium sp. BR 1433 TaxID=3447967 RepID=UPI003EE62132